MLKSSAIFDRVFSLILGPMALRGFDRFQFNKHYRRNCGQRSRSKAISALVVAAILILSAGIEANAGNPEPLKSVQAPKNNPQTPEKIELGKKLFFDRRLSGDGTMSCASCHIPEQAFADGQDISMSYPTTKNWRNAPGLINVAFYRKFFHDGRAKSLEDQALFPMMSAFEMNQNLDFLEEEIRVVPEYVEAFMKAFDGEPTRTTIAMAIAAFERSLVSVNAPYDKFLNGDSKAISEDAQKGFEIFKGKGRCAECHYGVILSDDRFHALNVPENTALENDPRVITTMRFVAKVYRYPDYRNLNEDLGRYLISKDKLDWKAFRTPMLREISRTAPYMHNGVFSTLDEVIDFFDAGGGKGNRVLTPLNLSSDEKKQLKLFLVEALTGEELKIKYPDVP